MVDRKLLLIFGALLGLLGLGWFWYLTNWETVLALFLLLWGNNIGVKYA